MNKKTETLENNKLHIVAIIMSTVAILLSIYAIWGAFSVAESDNYNGTRIMEVHQHSSENRAAIDRLVECQTNSDSCSEINWNEPYSGVRDVSNWPRSQE